VCGDAFTALAALTGLTRLDMTVPEYMDDESLCSLTALTALKRIHWAWCKDVPPDNTFCAFAPSSLTTVTFYVTCHADKMRAWIFSDCRLASPRSTLMWMYRGAMTSINTKAMAAGDQFLPVAQRGD
jgi:hypothetical protein